MSKPRDLSFVKFDYDSMPADYHDSYEFGKDEIFLFLGEIAGMDEHCAVISTKTSKLHAGYHIENFVEINNES